jgi:superfamily II DNA or RNA helicase
MGEGFDDPRLDTLFVALPVSWRGTIAQYVGRLHRLREGKREVRVYDYADLNVPMLARMFDRRCRGYEALGYTILLPASACRDGPPMCRCRSIRSGKGITPPVFAGLFATAWTRHWQSYLSTPRARRRRMPKAKTAPEAQLRHFSIAAWNRCPKPPAIFD